MERNLRLIYDYLDNGNYKAALTSIDKLLKKTIAHPMILAYALDRLGRSQESLEICKTLLKLPEIKQDESTISTISLVLRNQGEYKLMNDVYESLYTSDPQNASKAEDWFYNLIRLQDFKSLQLASIRLSRGFKQDNYLFWSIQCLYLLVVFNQSENPTLHLNLAQKMLEKSIEQGKLKDYQSLHMYLQVLERQGKYQDCLSVLNGPLGGLIKVEKDLRGLLVHYHSCLNEWDIVQDLSKSIIDKQLDDWTFYSHYIESIQENSNDFLEFLGKLKSKSIQDDFICRGPFLAELHLRAKFNMPIVDCLIEYIKRFGSLLVCFEDVKPFLFSFVGSPSVSATVSAKDTNKSAESKREIELKEFLSKISLIQEEWNSENVNHLRMTITIEKIRYCLGLNRSKEWKSMYESSLNLGRDLDKRERQYGDDFILLIVLTCLETFYRENPTNLDILYELVSILEDALDKSLFNYHFKILLIRIYILLGVYERPLELYKSLEIKQIQNDSLSYLICNDLDTFGSLSLLKEATNTTKSIYTNNNRETPEMIILAFKNQTFSKIPEFIDFRMKLEYSWQRAMTEIISLRCHWMYSFEILTFSFLDKLLLQENIEKLSDNRDFKIFPFWKKEFDVTKVLFDDFSKDWIVFYARLLSYLSSLDNSKPKDSKNNESTTSIQEFMSNQEFIRDERESRLKRIAKCFNACLEYKNKESHMIELINEYKLDLQSFQYRTILERNQVFMEYLQIHALLKQFIKQELLQKFVNTFLERIELELESIDCATTISTSNSLSKKVWTRMKKDWKFTLIQIQSLLL